MAKLIECVKRATLGCWTSYGPNLPPAAMPLMHSSSPGTTDWAWAGIRHKHRHRHIRSQGTAQVDYRDNIVIFYSCACRVYSVSQKAVVDVIQVR